MEERTKTGDGSRSHGSIVVSALQRQPVQREHRRHAQNDSLGWAGQLHYITYIVNRKEATGRGQIKTSLSFESFLVSCTFLPWLSHGTPITWANTRSMMCFIRTYACYNFCSESFCPIHRKRRFPFRVPSASIYIARRVQINQLCSVPSCLTGPWMVRVKHPPVIDLLPIVLVLAS